MINSRVFPYFSNKKYAFINHVSILQIYFFSIFQFYEDEIEGSCRNSNLYFQSKSEDPQVLNRGKFSPFEPKENKHFQLEIHFHLECECYLSIYRYL